MRRVDAVLLGVLVVAANLRIAIVGVAPLLDDLRHDTGLSSAAAGLVTTIPFFCMAVFAFVGAALVRRIGYTALITASLAGLAVAVAVRAVMPSGGLILLLTVPVGVTIALVAVSLPPVVKARFPRRSGAITGGYVVAMKIGGAAASLAAVPLANALGGWRAAMAAAAAPALLALPIWLRGRHHAIPRPRRSGPALRRPRPLAVLLALVFGSQALSFAGMSSWVAVVYQDAGWSPELAGATTAFIAVASIPLALVIPAWSDGRDRRRWMVATAIVMTAGTVGIGLAPTTAAWLWLSLFAIGNGPLFPLSLTLPLDAGRDTSDVANLTMWTLGLGYLLGASGPVLVGWLRDASGGFTVPLLVLAAAGLLSGVLALLAPATRTSESALDGQFV